MAEQTVGQHAKGDDLLQRGPHRRAITGDQAPIVGQFPLSAGFLVDPVPDDPEPVIGLVVNADLQPRRRSLRNDHRPVAGFQRHHPPQPRHELGEEALFVALRNGDPPGRDELPEFLGQRPVQPGQDHPARRRDRPVPPTDHAVRRIADQPHARRVQHVAVQPDRRRHREGRRPGHVDGHPRGLTRDLDVAGALAAATELDPCFRRMFQQIPDTGTDLTVRGDPRRRRFPRGAATLGLDDGAQALELVGQVLARVLGITEVPPGHSAGHPPTLGIALHRPDPDLRRAEQVVRLVDRDGELQTQQGALAGRVVGNRRRRAQQPVQRSFPGGGLCGQRKDGRLRARSADLGAGNGGHQVLQQRRDAVLAVGFHRAVAAALEVLHLTAGEAEPNVRLVRPGSGADHGGSELALLHHLQVEDRAAGDDAARPVQRCGPDVPRQPEVRCRVGLLPRTSMLPAIRWSLRRA